jgi:hypothetical protein
MRGGGQFSEADELTPGDSNSATIRVGVTHEILRCAQDDGRYGRLRRWCQKCEILEEALA